MSTNKSAVFVICCLVGTCIQAPSSSEAGLAADTYLIPVVARNPGSAGSDWRTEVCLTNPLAASLTITLGLLKGGVVAGKNVTVQPDRTVCSEDFLLTWFGTTKWQGALLAGTTSSLNPGMVSRQFLISVRVYNKTSSGTYGLSVTPEAIIGNLLPGADFYPVGFMTGLHNWGQAGVNGSRSSIGVFNWEESSTRVTILVANGSGTIVWQKTENVAGLTQTQYSIPTSVYLNGGFAAVGTEGSSEVQAYATVTDNETGDGRYIAGNSLWLDSKKNTSNGRPAIDFITDLLNWAADSPETVIDANQQVSE